MLKEDQLDSYFSSLLQKRLIGIIFLGFFLFSSWGIIDYIVTPGNFKIFIVGRLAIVSLLFGLYVLYRLKTGRIYQYTILIAGTVLSSIIVELIILSYGGHQSPYFAGMILIVFCILGFIPLNLWLSFAIIFIVYFIYISPIIILDNITDSHNFIINNFSMLSTFIIALVWRTQSQKALVNEFKLHSDLAEEMGKVETSVKKEQKVVRELAILNEMISSITSELEFDSTIQTFIEHARILIKSEYGAVLIFEGTQNKLINFKFSVESGSSISPTVPVLNFLPDDFTTMSGPLRINSPTENTPIGYLSVENMITIPLASKDRILTGLLFLANKKGGFTQEDEDSLINFSFQVFEIISLHKEIASLAVIDGLTGLYNHRSFQEKLSEEMERAKRYGRTMVLIMIDIDHFKSFNDIYGHQTGDAVLKSISRIIDISIRSVDFAARYGGEEFMVILPETGCEEAGLVAERIRANISRNSFTTETGENVMITVSIGMVCFPDDGKDKEDIIKKVDKALYFAKEQGRNMVCNYRDTLAGIIERKPEELDNILKDPSLKGIKELATAIDARSTYMRGHSLKVAAYAMGIAKNLGLDDSKIEAIRIAGILHDVGNVTIPLGVLNKPGTLTEEEKMIIKGHPGLAEMILKKYPHMEEVLPTILYHHERYDGNGYPLGLKGDAIPLSARILAVAEAFQAMVSSRSYRERLPLDYAIEELRKNTGTQFDPEVVEAFIKIMKNNTG